MWAAASPRRTLYYLVVILPIWSVALRVAPQYSESPTDAIHGTASRVRSILEDPAKLMPRRRMLEEVIAGRLDHAEMSKRALAAYWTPLTETQPGEFVELFKSFLSDRYAEKVEGYSGEQVAYLSERTEGTYAEVRTELQSSKVEIPMDYCFFLKEGRWHAYDIIVDGVSLVKHYRSQFQKIIRDEFP